MRAQNVIDKPLLGLAFDENYSAAHVDQAGRPPIRFFSQISPSA